MKQKAPLIDEWGRQVRYLRISVTDRCNFRCRYCMPLEGASFKPRQDILSYEEILRMARVMTACGVSRYRITGGEPLVRMDLPALIEGLGRLSGVEDLSLTTNGFILAGQAQALKAAGLNRINISLDSLSPDTFAHITRWGSWKAAWQGIEAALAAGLDPVKINVVLLKGVNDSEIPAFAQLTRDYPLHVRFIELMPRGDDGLDHSEQFFPVTQARAICEGLGDLAEDESVKGNGPAVGFRYAGAPGSLGFIGAISCNFCHRCNRMRLSADGKLRPCLDNATHIDFKEALRSGMSDLGLEALIRKAVAMKPESHDMEVQSAKMDWEPMCAIGG